MVLFSTVNEQWNYLLLKALYNLIMCLIFELTFLPMNVVLHVCCNDVFLYTSSCNFMITYIGLIADFVDQGVLYNNSY